MCFFCPLRKLIPVVIQWIECCRERCVRWKMAAASAVGQIEECWIFFSCTIRQRQSPDISCSIFTYFLQIGLHSIWPPEAVHADNQCTILLEDFAGFLYGISITQDVFTHQPECDDSRQIIFFDFLQSD